MFHLKLTKGLSYTNGIISATKKEPDVYTEDNAVKDMAVESGYFALVKDEVAHQEMGHIDKAQLEEMTVPNLKKLAADMGIDATGLKNKADYVAAIAAQEITLDAENDETAEGVVDYGEE